MKQIINAKIVTPEEILEGKTLLFEEKIVGIVDEPLKDAETYDAEGKYLVPGFIDIHIHGYDGEDSSDGNEEGLRKMARGIYKNGVTSFLPTTVTLGYDTLEKAFDTARKLKADRHEGEARVLGVHAEGPFINIKRKGAQAGEFVAKPDGDFVVKHKDIVRLITLAPEMDENFECIKKIRRCTCCRVSMGHTDADYATAKASLKAGVTHATHLFNAMTAINHREPGVAGAGLFDPDVSCELICDTFHVNSALFKPVFELKGDKINLITDSIRAAGLSDGDYTLGGLKVNVKGIKCLLEDGTIAGSVLKLNNAVKNVMDAGVPMVKAIAAASYYPAMAIGFETERGAIKEGLYADFSLVDKDINIYKVFTEGKLEYKAN